MDIALKLVVNYKFDVIISRTQCNCMTWLLHIYKVTCSNLVIPQFINTCNLNSFINISSINELTYRRSKTSFECVNVKC